MKIHPSNIHSFALGEYRLIHFAVEIGPEAQKQREETEGAAGSRLQKMEERIRGLGSEGVQEVAAAKEKVKESTMLDLIEEGKNLVDGDAVSFMLEGKQHTIQFDEGGWFWMTSGTSSLLWGRVSLVRM